MAERVKRPAFQFYPADWRRDTAVQVCSLEARGLWHEMLCIMHDGTPYGHLSIEGQPVSVEQLARLVGANPPRVRKLLAELEAHNVFSRNDENPALIYSRRMVRDEHKRDVAASEGQKGGSPKLGVEYNVPGFVYAMRRSGDGAIKIGIATQPSNRLYRVRRRFPDQVVDLLAAMHTEDMGATEAALHRKYAQHSIAGGEWFALPSDLENELLDHLKVKGKGISPPSVAVAVSSASALRTTPSPSDVALAAIVGRVPGEYRSDVEALVGRVPSPRAWLAEIGASLDGMPGHRPVTGEQLGRAVRDFNANGAEPNLRLFRRFLEGATDASSTPTNGSRRPAKASRFAPPSDTTKAIIADMIAGKS